LEKVSVKISLKRVEDGSKNQYLISLSKTTTKISKTLQLIQE
jgi:hypothetical protein